MMMCQEFESSLAIRRHLKRSPTVNDIVKFHRYRGRAGACPVKKRKGVCISTNWPSHTLRLRACLAKIEELAAFPLWNGSTCRNSCHNGQPFVAPWKFFTVILILQRLLQWPGWYWYLLCWTAALFTSFWKGRNQLFVWANGTRPSHPNGP